MVNPAPAVTPASTAVTGTADPHPSAEEIALLRQWNALQSGFRRLTCQLLADVEVKAAVPPSSFQVLWFLLTTPGRTARMHQLTHTLGFSTAGTTKVVDRLAEAGLIERSPSPADRRVTFATLTEHGVQVATTAALALAEALRERIVRPHGDGYLANLAAAITPLDPKHAPAAAGDAPHDAAGHAPPDQDQAQPCE